MENSSRATLFSANSRRSAEIISNFCSKGRLAAAARLHRSGRQFKDFGHKETQEFSP
jgi:hypothetical protein